MRKGLSSRFSICREGLCMLQKWTWAGHDICSDRGEHFTLSKITVVIYVSSEGKKLYLKNLYLPVDILFLYMCLSIAQLERQGGKGGWRNNAIDRSNQRNNRSLCQQIYQYSCAKGLLQTFYWRRYCLKLFLTGNATLLSIFDVWINPSKLWITFCSIAFSYY